MPVDVSQFAVPLERPHAPRSASQLKYLAICPGYRPEHKKTVHWVTQQGLRGHTAMEEGNGDELQSEYEAKLVQLCHDYEATLPPAHSELKEVRVETIEGRWGYIDLIRFRDRSPLRAMPNEADMVDYKFVRKKEVEDAEVNLQGKDYVVGAFDKFPHLEKIHVHFVMPRFGSVTTATFTREDLPRLRLEVFSILNRAKRTDRKNAKSSLFTPCYDVCTYCGFKARCPAMFKLAKKVAEAYVGKPLPAVPENVHPSQTKDPVTMGALKALATVLKPWADSVNHHVTSAALDEGVIPAGYVIDYQKGQRKITDPLALLRVGPEFKLTVDDVVDSSKVSVSKIEKIVMAKAVKGKKGHTKSAFLDRLRDVNALLRSEDRPYLRKVDEEPAAETSED